ncbi:hypothetical protein OQA88_5417 [Cercophora sp. LCS_1]
MDNPLEVDLEVIGLLIGASSVCTFNDMAVIKGYNAAFVPTNCRDLVIRWHLIINDDGSRLAYTDERITQSYGLPMMSEDELLSLLDVSRHVLGWLPKAACHIGSPSASYNIGWSSPDPISPRCALEKVIISGGTGFLSAGAEFSFGRKDKSPTIKRDMAYFEALNSLSTSYVVLYDMKDHRAWLCNGVNALLHLVRASIQQDRSSAFRQEFLLDPAALQEEPDDTSPEAAVRFLRNRHNLALPLFKDLDQTHLEEATANGRTIATEYRTSQLVSLKNRVGHIMEVLEQLLDYQASVDVISSAATSGLPMKLSPRSRLEGYRFMDIAARRPVTAKTTKLEIFNGAGKSWVDFVRALKAVTLFGEGFGELIQPPDHDIDEVCQSWRTVPCDRDYLTVGEYDLSQIIQQEGSMSSNPVKLVPGIFWDTAQQRTCLSHCANNKSVENGSQGLRMQAACDPAQALVPMSFMRAFTRSGSQPSVGTDGAVIFGRSRFHLWKWPDHGEPTREQTAPADENVATTDTPTAHLDTEPRNRNTGEKDIWTGISSFFLSASRPSTSNLPTETKRQRKAEERTRMSRVMASAREFLS